MTDFDPHLTIQVPNVPGIAMEKIIAEFGKHGVQFMMAGEYRGVATCEAGTVIFKWESEVLTVVVTRDEGHFPMKMLRGGLKQIVGEVVEGLQ